MRHHILYSSHGFQHSDTSVRGIACILMSVYVFRVTGGISFSFSPNICCAVGFAACLFTVDSFHFANSERRSSSMMVRRTVLDAYNINKTNSTYQYIMYEYIISHIHAIRAEQSHSNINTRTHVWEGFLETQTRL